MNTFDLNNKRELGGFKSIKIIPIEKILNCPRFLTNENSSTFTYSTDELLDTQIYPVHETIVIGAKPSKTKNGILYNVNGSFEIPFVSKELESIFAKFLEKEIVALAVKFNGQQLLYGSLRFPLIFTYELKNAKKLENPTKLVAKISGSTPQKPVYRS